jgi:hypothetical protein
MINITQHMSRTRNALEYMILITQHSMSGTRFVLEYMIIITQHSMSRTRFVLEYILSLLLNILCQEPSLYWNI